jgi:hypothetical protein
MADLTARAAHIAKQAEKAIARHKQALEYSPEAPEGLETSEGTKPLMGMQRYPEFKPLVEEIVHAVVTKINAEARKIQSEMPYKAQFTLEEVIKELQDRV